MNSTVNKKAAIEQIEIDLLLEAAYRTWGYDFRSYAQASINRRIRLFQRQLGCPEVADMIPRVIHDPSVFSELLDMLSAPVSELFRDPSCYASIRQNVFPLLKARPHFKIWHAGCASGEEVYSLAILLAEDGILDRATIYATDFNEDALERARDGVYETDKIQAAEAAYHLAGGQLSLKDYFHEGNEASSVRGSLKRPIVFSNHNLATDSSFGEMNLIICRNVFIYFNRGLQNMALDLFSESLVPGGFLCLGKKESLPFTHPDALFEAIDMAEKVYKKGAE